MLLYVAVVAVTVNLLVALAMLSLQSLNNSIYCSYMQLQMLCLWSSLRYLQFAHTYSVDGSRKVKVVTTFNFSILQTITSFIYDTVILSVIGRSISPTGEIYLTSQKLVGEDLHVGY